MDARTGRRKVQFAGQSTGPADCCAEAMADVPLGLASIPSKMQDADDACEVPKGRTLSGKKSEPRPVKVVEIAEKTEVFNRHNRSH